MLSSMPTFVDLHCHALFGVDDGAQSFDEMCAMVDASYADGVRALFLTPHFHLGFFGDNRQKSVDAFRQLGAYVRQSYPDMKLYLANELQCCHDCVSWLDEGLCRTLRGSRYVLVDFALGESARSIESGLTRLLNAGYVPILAHPERYIALGTFHKELKSLRSKGVLLQLDAQSPLGGFGLSVKMRANSLLREGLVDFIGSDAHDCKVRPPQISAAYFHIEKKYGRDYADAICRRNALKLLRQIANEMRELG